MGQASRKAVLSGVLRPGNTQPSEIIGKIQEKPDANLICYPQLLREQKGHGLQLSVRIKLPYAILRGDSKNTMRAKTHV